MTSIARIPSRSEYIRIVNKFQNGYSGSITEECLKELFPHLENSQIAYLFNMYKAAINAQTKRGNHGLFRTHIALPPLHDGTNYIAFFSYSGRIHVHTYRWSFGKPKASFLKRAESFAKTHWQMPRESFLPGEKAYYRQIQTIPV